MSEDTDLQAKIDDLSQRIKRHKNNEPSRQQPASQYHSYGSHQWTPQRGTPYGIPRGRGRVARPSLNRNRTLIVNNGGQAQGNGPLTSPVVASPSTNPSDPLGQGWVSKRDRHMVLINNSVYEQKTLERTKAMEKTRKQKQQAREDREKAKIHHHLQSLHSASSAAVHTASTPLELTIQDIRYAIVDGGSKLIKISGLYLVFYALFLALTAYA